MIEERVKAFIDKYNLSGKFLVAFSGGFDSMCLLNILYTLGCDVTAIHLNHNWRGEESRQEEKNCRKFALKRNIEFYSETLPDGIPHTENNARDARYKFFERCANKYGSNVLFTAHNYNDNAETVLYRIIKGTGTIGLQGIAEHRDIYYRPLLTTKREEIEEYCLKNKLIPNKDSSNENIKYKRNLIRKKILPLMTQINPNIIDAINSLSQIAKEDAECINSQKYFIRQLLIDNNIEYDRKKIEEISEFINKNKNLKSGKTLSLTDNLWLFVSDKEIKTITKPAKSNIEVRIDKEGEYRIGDKIFLIKALEGWMSGSIDIMQPDNNAYKIQQPDNSHTSIPLCLHTSDFFHDSDYKACISIDKIDFTLRYRQDGDFIHPLGCSGKQKLKKYLNEKKVPNHKKDNIVLLCKEKEVLWVSGYGISNKIKVKDKPTHIIELRDK